MIEGKISVAYGKRYRDLGECQGQSLFGTIAQFAILRKAAPVGPDQLLVLRLGGMEFLWVVFHAIIRHFEK